MPWAVENRRGDHGLSHPSQTPVTEAVILQFTIRNRHSVSGTEFLKPLENVSDGSFVKEVTFEPHLRMGAGCQENQLWDQRVVTFGATPHPPGRKGVESITSGE